MNLVWFCYTKISKQLKVCYMDIDSFIIHIKTEDFCKDIADDVKNKYETSSYEVDRSLPKGTNKKVIIKDLMEDVLERKIITELVALRPKTYSYLTDDDKNVKKN